MDAKKVDLFLMTNEDKFPAMQRPLIREKLLELDESKWDEISLVSLKNPIVTQVLSLGAGIFGADRFYLGETGLGVAKLLTCGAAGVWWLIDMFTAYNRTKEKNFQKLQFYLFK